MQLNREFIPIMSKDQMDIEATKFLLKYYPKALETPMALPVEDIAEFKMGLDIDYVNINEDSSVLGMMIFLEGIVELYDPDKGGYISRKYNRGTILVEKNIVESGNRGRERFTIAHEIAHWYIHKPRFAMMALKDKSLAVACRCPKKKVSNIRTVEDWMEWQADNLAAAIIMPAEMFKQKARELKLDFNMAIPLKDSMYIDSESKLINDLIIQKLSNIFQVSKQAAKIRFETLEIEFL